MPSANYTAERVTVDAIPVVRLRDLARQTEVMIVPSLGNNAYDMTVRGQKILWSPYASLGELKAKPAQAGNPFLAPWANRIDQNAFWANGRRFLLNPDLKNYRLDAWQQPIHGLLVFADWEVVSLRAEDSGAAVTSRLEFHRHPEWMAQFPFAHVLEMTYRLRNGELEVETVIENLARQPLPLSLGYHTYYQLPGVARDEWKVGIAARERLVLSSKLVPTGERQPVEGDNPLPLAGTQLDDVFSGLTRGADGRADWFVEGGGKKISVLYGPKYTVSVVYAPPGRGFICFEPMTAITNAFNLAHTGVYRELQHVAPGGRWAESFWIRPSGF